MADPKDQEQPNYSLDAIPLFLRDSLPMNKVSVSPGQLSDLQGYAASHPKAASYVDNKNPLAIRVLNRSLFNQGVLDHELSHAYQDQLPGVKFAPVNPNDLYGYGGTAGLLADQKAHRKVTDYSPEQLARIVEDNTNKTNSLMDAAKSGKLYQEDLDDFNQWQHAAEPLLRQFSVLSGKKEYPAFAPAPGFISELPEVGNRRMPLPANLPHRPIAPQVTAPPATPGKVVTGAFGTRIDDTTSAKADPYAEFGGNVVHTGTGPDPYAEFGGSVVHGPPAPGTGLNRYGQIDYGTGLAPAHQSQEGAAPAPRTPSWMQRMARAGENFGTATENSGIGALKGAGSTMSAADDWSRKHLPAFMTNTGMGFGRPENIPAEKALFQPKGTAQSVGKGIEQAGEFLIPGLGEDAATADISRVTPKLMPAARIGYNALTSGLLNKAQGGSFGTGAAVGGGAGLLGEGARIVAPALAESALGVRGIDRLYGRTPGRAILEDTRGIRPAKVASTAQRTIDRLTPEAENIAATAGQSGVRGSLFPARQAVASRVGSHEANRAMESAAELKPLQHALATDRLTGLPLAENQTPLGLMRLKRGINSDFIGNWKPDQSPGLRTTAKQAYSALNNQLHHVAPGLGPIDQRISSLIPVAKRAEAQEVSAPFVQRVLGRMKAHTGAATLGGIGAIGGYERGGPKKALEYGLIGLAAPEILASPSVQMAGARTLHSPVVKKLLVPAAKGGALQLAARRRK